MYEVPHQMASQLCHPAYVSFQVMTFAELLDSMRTDLSTGKEKAETKEISQNSIETLQDSTVKPVTIMETVESLQHKIQPSRGLSVVQARHDICV